MTATPMELVLSRLPNAKKNGKGYSARCPAHEDDRPSLSITEGEDGRALLYCHAGCSVEDICGALKVSVSDLMADDGTDVDRTPKTFGKKEVVSTSTEHKGFGKAEEAIAALERKRGKASAAWSYHNARGDVVGEILRWDTSSGKTILPIAKVSGQWHLGGMPEPRPLYRLPDLLGADRVFITEGEKAAEAARKLDLVATTSAHGAGSPGKTDWRPLAGKECVILPDNDEAGRGYANEVIKILAAVNPSPQVKIVELPDLPDKGDLVNWIEAQPDTSREESCRRLNQLADKAEVVETNRPQPLVARYRPFPVDALPEPIRQLVADGSRAIGCDPAFVALPMLTVLASAIGNTRRIQLKQGWTEPAILWTGIVGESGTKKSPALDLALKPVREKQQKAFSEREKRLRSDEDAMLRYHRDLNHWKKNSNDEPPPDKPTEPVADRYCCDDATMEALADLLRNEPRGTLLAKDELAGWIGGFDRYVQGSGGDVARWLEVFNGRSMVVDRKSGRPPTLSIPRAAVSVTGGIQPEVLRRSLGREYRENGLAARLLLAYPPRQVNPWREWDIDPQLEKQVAKTVNRLYDMPLIIGEDGAPCPKVISLTQEAKDEWVEFYNKHAEEQLELSGDLSAAWSKLEGYAARLALVIQLAHWAAKNPESEPPDLVDEQCMQAAIKLTRWFANEARRIYAILDEDNRSRELRQLVDLVERKGGKITPREMMRSSQQWKTSAEAEEALNQLVKAGHGQWTDSFPSSKGGRPTRTFVLHDATDVDETAANPAETTGFVNVNEVEPSDDK